MHPSSGIISLNNLKKINNIKLLINVKNNNKKKKKEYGMEYK